MSIISSLLEPLTKIETCESVATKLTMIIIYIIVTLIVIKILDKMIAQGFKMQNKSKEGNKKRSRALISLIQNVIKCIVWFIVVTTILSRFDISVEGVVANAGIISLVVGFGAQTIVKDVVTGFFIIFESQFDVGDYVKINNGGATVAERTVKSIGLRSTRINTISGELTILPNNSMGEIANYSIASGTVIVKVPVFIDEDIGNVEKRLNKLFTFLCGKYYLFVSDPVMIGIDTFEDTRVILGVSAETIPGEGFSGTHIIRKEVQKMFLQEDIKTPQPIVIPFNHGENGV